MECKGIKVLLVSKRSGNTIEAVINALAAYEVKAAAAAPNVEAVLDKILEAGPDILFFDGSMTTEEKMELIKKIRFHCSKITIVSTLSGAKRQMKDNVENAGADRCVIGPGGVLDIVGAINQL